MAVGRADAPGCRSPSDFPISAENGLALFTEKSCQGIDHPCVCFGVAEFELGEVAEQGLDCFVVCWRCHAVDSNRECLCGFVRFDVGRRDQEFSRQCAHMPIFHQRRQNEAKRRPILNQVRKVVAAPPTKYVTQPSLCRMLNTAPTRLEPSGKPGNNS